MSVHRHVCHVLGAAIAASSVTLTAFAASANVAPRPAHVHFGQVRPAIASGTLNVLHSFNGSDGSAPQGSLAYGLRFINNIPVTTLFGAAQQGGPGLDGSIFKQTISPSPSFATAFAFNGTDGATPSGGVASYTGDYTHNGPFIGVTQFGGKYGMGALYEVTANGAHMVLHSFSGKADGANPIGRVVFFHHAIFGTTSAGANGYGTVYKYEDGSVQTLHTFSGLADGGTPLAGLSERVVIPMSSTAARQKATLGKTVATDRADWNYVDGALYGVASVGGGATGGSQGTIFSITPSGTFRTLVTFDGNTVPGSTPSTELTGDLNGNLFGTTTDGGTAGVGEVFAYNPATGLTIIQDLSFDPNTSLFPFGANPVAPLTVATNGALYGTTSGGAANGLGNIFTISPTSGFTVLYQFAGPDGATPACQLVDGLNGLLYGTTSGGGANGLGEIFAIAE